MRKSWIVLFAVGMSLPLAAVEVDGIAAKVGSETILRSDVFLEMRRLNAPESAYAQIRNEIIERKLIVKAAAEAKMTMQEWVIEGRIRDLIKRAFDGDRNKLMDTLAKQKISYPEWRARMKEDMIVSAMRWNVIDKNMSAGPTAMQKEFEEHPERYSIGRKSSIAVILLKPENKDKRVVIDAALKTVDFADLARQYSADSHAAEGGLWKDVNPEEVFKPEICAEINRMPKGTISHWIELDGWSFLLKKIADEPGKARTFAEAYDQIEANLKEDLAKKAYQAWIERLRAETYIKVY